MISIFTEQTIIYNILKRKLIKSIRVFKTFLFFFLLLQTVCCFHDGLSSRSLTNMWTALSIPNFLHMSGKTSAAELSMPFVSRARTVGQI